VAEKHDFLSVCNDHGVPVRDFEAQFCFRCLQPECTRSLSGKSRFERRVDTWEDQFFNHVPRMSEADPRFVQLRAKKFIEIERGPVPEIGRAVRAWIDPRDLDAAPESPHSTEDSPPVPPAEVAEEESSTLTETPLSQSPPPPVLMNTPFRQGQMLRGSKPAAPPRDPWAAKPKEPEIPKVRPGAKIKLGGSGV